MSRPLTVLKYLAVFIVGGFVLSAVLYVYMLLGAIGLVWTPYTCLTDVLGQTYSRAGHYFEVNLTSCSGIGKGPAEISVSAPRSRWGRKALICKYESMADSSPDAHPVVELVDDWTIRISVKHVAMIICRSRQWEALAVEYNIGRVVDTDDAKPPGEYVQD